MKEGVSKDNQGTNYPALIWCYAAEQRAKILTLTTKTNISTARAESSQIHPWKNGQYLHLMTFCMV